MGFLRRIGIDSYMLLLLGTVLLGLMLPVRGIAAEGLGQVTYGAVALLFLLYGAKLDPASVKAGMLNWRLQGLTFAATYLMIPVLGMAFALIFGDLLGPQVTLGLVFLALLPSTIQSSIAFVSMAGGNVPAAICAASLSNLVGVALTPALVAVLLRTGEGGVDLDAVLRIGVQILLPFVLGQLLRPWIGAFVRNRRTLTLVVDRGAILLIVYSAFSAGTVSGLWAAIPPLSLIALIAVMLGLLACIFAMMLGVGRAFGLPPEDRSVLFFCGSTKSLATGLPIATALFPAETVGATVLPVLVLRIGVQILLPFVLGQLLRPWIGAFVRNRRTLTLVVDRGAILLIVYSAFSAGTVSGLWAAIPPLSLIALIAVMLGLLACIFAMMLGVGRAFGLPPEDRSVLFFCGSTKSLATGLPIATALFPAETVGATVLPVLIYHMAQLLICAMIAQNRARRNATALVA